MNTVLVRWPIQHDHHNKKWCWDDVMRIACKFFCLPPNPQKSNLLMRKINLVGLLVVVWWLWLWLLFWDEVLLRLYRVCILTMSNYGCLTMRFSWPTWNSLPTSGWSHIQRLLKSLPAKGLGEWPALPSAACFFIFVLIMHMCAMVFLLYNNEVLYKIFDSVS